MQKSRIFGSLTLSKLFIVLCAIFTFSTNNASGVACTWVVCYDGASFTEYDYSGSGCSTKRERCADSIKLTDCTACKSGYSASTTTTTISGCSISYTTCVYGGATPGTGCTDDSHCSSYTTAWQAAVTTGYQSRTYGKCSGGLCLSQTQVRCAAGYYGFSASCTTSSCTGCSRCDEFTGDGDSSNAYYGTSAAGSIRAANCYVPAGEEFSDTTGTWSFTDDCHNGLI